MAQRGRKPKPTNLKILEGNPGRRPLNLNEPRPPVDDIECPEWLGEIAREEWARTAPMLRSMGLLTAADVMALAAYCDNVETYLTCREFILTRGSVVKTPSGYIQQVPQVSQMNKALHNMREFMSEFGMTPASRSRLNIETPSGNDGDSMMLALLGGA